MMTGIQNRFYNKYLNINIGYNNTKASGDNSIDPKKDDNNVSMQEKHKFVGAGSWKTQQIKDAGLELPSEYFIGVYTDYYRFNIEKVSQDFPGKIIMSLEDLKKAIESKKTGEKQGSVGGGSWHTLQIKNAGLEQYSKYFIGVYTDYYRFNPDTVSSDFPDKSIQTLADLKTAIDELEKANPSSADNDNKSVSWTEELQEQAENLFNEIVNSNDFSRFEEFADYAGVKITISGASFNGYEITIYYPNGEEYSTNITDSSEIKEFLQTDLGKAIFVTEDNPAENISTVDEIINDPKETEEPKNVKYTFDDLKNEYNLTNRDIFDFFEKNNINNKYTINQDAVKSIFGKDDITTVEQLMDAIKNIGFTKEYIQNNYGFSAEQIDKYLVQKSDNRYVLNKDAVRADFGDREVNTIGQLKIAVNPELSDYVSFDDIDGYSENAKRYNLSSLISPIRDQLKEYAKDIMGYRFSDDLFDYIYNPIRQEFSQEGGFNVKEVIDSFLQRLDSSIKEYSADKPLGTEQGIEMGFDFTKINGYAQNVVVEGDFGNHKNTSKTPETMRDLAKSSISYSLKSNFDAFKNYIKDAFGEYYNDYFFEYLFDAILTDVVNNDSIVEVTDTTYKYRTENLINEFISVFDSKVSSIGTMIDELNAVAESKGVDKTEYVYARLIEFLIMKVENPNMTIDEMNEQLAFDKINDMLINSISAIYSENSNEEIKSVDDLIELQQAAIMDGGHDPKLRIAYMNTRATIYLQYAKDGKLTNEQYYNELKNDLTDIFPGSIYMSEEELADLQSKLEKLDLNQIKIFIDKCLSLPSVDDTNYQTEYSAFITEFNDAVSESSFTGVQNPNQKISLNELYKDITGVEFNADNIIESAYKIEKANYLIDQTAIYLAVQNLNEKVENGEISLGDALWQIGYLYTGSTDSAEIITFLRKITGNDDIYVSNNTVIIPQTSMAPSMGGAGRRSGEKSLWESVMNFCSDTYHTVADNTEAAINSAAEILSDPDTYISFGEDRLTESAIWGVAGLTAYCTTPGTTFGGVAVGTLFEGAAMVEGIVGALSCGIGHTMEFVQNNSSNWYEYGKNMLVDTFNGTTSAIGGPIKIGLAAIPLLVTRTKNAMNGAASAIKLGEISGEFFTRAEQYAKLIGDFTHKSLGSFFRWDTAREIDLSRYHLEDLPDCIKSVLQSCGFNRMMQREEGMLSFLADFNEMLMQIGKDATKYLHQFSAVLKAMGYKDIQLFEMYDKEGNQIYTILAKITQGEHAGEYVAFATRSDGTMGIISKADFYKFFANLSKEVDDATGFYRKFLGLAALFGIAGLSGANAQTMSDADQLINFMQQANAFEETNSGDPSSQGFIKFMRDWLETGNQFDWTYMVNEYTRQDPNKVVVLPDGSVSYQGKMYESLDAWSKANGDKYAVKVDEGGTVTFATKDGKTDETQIDEVVCVGKLRKNNGNQNVNNNGSDSDGKSGSDSESESNGDNDNSTPPVIPGTGNYGDTDDYEDPNDEERLKDLIESGNYANHWSVTIGGYTVHYFDTDGDGEADIEIEIA